MTYVGSLTSPSHHLELSPLLISADFSLSLKTGEWLLTTLSSQYPSIHKSIPQKFRLVGSHAHSGINLFPEEVCVLFLKWQPTPIFLPGKFHRQRSLVGCSPWGCKELDTTEVTQQQQQQEICLCREKSESNGGA